MKEAEIAGARQCAWPWETVIEAWDVEPKLSDSGDPETKLSEMIHRGSTRCRLSLNPFRRSTL